jgi:hypothetical protein
MGDVKAFFRFAAIPVGAIGLVALVGVLRHESLAETPGAVVESFLGHLSRERYQEAAPLLSSELEKRADPEVLKEWEREVRVGLGEIRGVRGKTEWISGEDAEATGVLKAGRRERRLRFGLKRERQRWVINRLDEFWLQRPPETKSIRIRERGRNRAAVPNRYATTFAR